MWVIAIAPETGTGTEIVLETVPGRDRREDLETGPESGTGGIGGTAEIEGIVEIEEIARGIATGNGVM